MTGKSKEIDQYRDLSNDMLSSKKTKPLLLIFKINDHILTPITLIKQVITSQSLTEIKQENIQMFYKSQTEQNILWWKIHQEENLCK